ncbi:MAG: transposase [Planctomycetes bacterium]|nr:transposase [Planctomycetota bacterium]
MGRAFGGPPSDPAVALQAGEAPEFHALPQLRDEDVAWLCRHVCVLIVSHLRRRSVVSDDGLVLQQEATEGEVDPLRACQAAAVQGRLPFGSVDGAAAEVFGTPRPTTPMAAKAQCADCAGFSLHAAVRIPAGRRDRLERLCRYVCRPPLCVERVRLTGDGRVACSFRKPWRNGVEGVRLDPQTFLSRLAAQVPPPRAHQVTYHGILAPASPCRSMVVPEVAEADSSERACGFGNRGVPTPVERLAQRLHQRASGGRRRRHYPWAELLKRVFAVDVLLCDQCGGRRKVLSFISDPVVIRRILDHLGLDTELPPIAPARAPPARLPLE